MSQTSSIQLKGELVSLDKPLVMGILNVTPDSFFSGSRYQTEQEILARAKTIIDEGGDIIDLGAYSSRPDSVDISVEQEKERLDFALSILKDHYPDAVYSVDTFRAEVAEHCVEKYGVDIINDISGGGLDDKMFETVADLQVPYVMMHMRGTPQSMTQYTDYKDLLPEVLKYFAERTDELYRLGVNDVIIDPGFGFSKTIDQNYEMMNHLEAFKIFDIPLLVGISRKSMIYKLFGTTPSESLNGTSVLNTLALMKGANILRVHDVREAREAIAIVSKTIESR